MAEQNSTEPVIHKDAEEVRGGETSGVMRYVLLISLGLAIVAMSAVWIIPALMQK